MIATENSYVMNIQATTDTMKTTTTGQIDTIMTGMTDTTTIITNIWMITTDTILTDMLLMKTI